MRLTDFWERMSEQFGPAYADSVARDFAISGLDGRTVHEALADGVAAKEVWAQLCIALELPAAAR